MAYYTLVQRIDGRWSIQFGDYDRETVAAEREDYKCHYDCGEMIRVKDLKIIKTASAHQRLIDAAVAKLNDAEYRKERATLLRAAIAARVIARTTNDYIDLTEIQLALSLLRETEEARQ